MRQITDAYMRHSASVSENEQNSFTTVVNEKNLHDQISVLRLKW